MKSIIILLSGSRAGGGPGTEVYVNRGWEGVVNTKGYQSYFHNNA